MPPLSIPCTIMRGGTSKALFFLDSDLAADPKVRDQQVLMAFGSPDQRQIDGLGGADPLTSKLAIIRKSDLPDVDVEYTFGQVSVTEAFIDYSANCGNISSAVGPFAIEAGLVPPVEPITRVRILNTNTCKMILAEVPVNGGSVISTGTFRIDGVPGTGAEIKLHFVDPAGAVTGRLLPTGLASQPLALEDGRIVEITVVDAGNPAILVRAEQIGLRGDELPHELEALPAAMAIIEEIRAKGSAILGLCANWREAFQHYRSLPKMVFVAPARACRTVAGAPVEAGDMDLMARVMTMGRPHKALAITAAIPTSVASRIPGSVAHSVCRAGAGDVRIGHPSGVVSVGVRIVEHAGVVSVEEVVVSRTARRLMAGRVFLRG